ncbi:dickkopf-related protein 3a [Nelusetta ayraudi]|uniref:dickkopf-related protein 3a n=1 Tax=Nelusetta ayraudi TaxID=303726 RepID=UPI003F7251D9
MMMRVAVLLLAFSAVCYGILPDIVDSGISHILGDDYGQGRTELDPTYVEVEQLQEDAQKKPEDGLQNNNQSISPQPSHLPPSPHDPDHVTNNDSSHSAAEQETNNITTVTPSSDVENSIEHGCVSAEDCGKGRYCHVDMLRSTCLQCKALDVSCTKDEECCNKRLCVWGQCSQNATRGEAGTTCQYQSDCSADLCCAFHKVLLFPVCLAKPVERERCLSAPNHLMDLLSWDSQNRGPKKHCPCVGALHCQHLGRGSMCLRMEDESEEELADSLYSEIDYII